MGLEILETLRTLGITVEVIAPDRLRFQPASRIPPDLVLRIREEKPAILAALARPTVEPRECKHCEGAGVCPCPACTLRRTEKPVPCLMCNSYQRQVWLAATRPEGCWHCGGSGKCGCIVCCNPLTREAGECVPCKGTGKVLAWLQ